MRFMLVLIPDVVTSCATVPFEARDTDQTVVRELGSEFRVYPKAPKSVEGQTVNQCWAKGDTLDMMADSWRIRTLN